MYIHSTCINSSVRFRLNYIADRKKNRHPTTTHPFNSTAKFKKERCTEMETFLSQLM